MLLLAVASGNFPISSVGRLTGSRSLRSVTHAYDSRQSRWRKSLKLLNDRFGANIVANCCNKTQYTIHGISAISTMVQMDGCNIFAI